MKNIWQISKILKQLRGINIYKKILISKYNFFRNVFKRRCNKCVIRVKWISLFEEARQRDLGVGDLMTHCMLIGCVVHIFSTLYTINIIIFNLQRWTK